MNRGGSSMKCPLRFLIPVLLLSLASWSYGQVRVTYNVLVVTPSGYIEEWNGSNGKIVHWRQNNPTYYVNSTMTPQTPTFTQASQAIQNAFASWQNIEPAQMYFTYDGPTSARKNMSDGKNVLFWSDDPDELLLFGGGAFSAATAVTCDTQTGEILDVDIVFNSLSWYDPRLEEEIRYNWTIGTFLYSIRTFDVQSIATHEIGHFVGAAHNPLDQWGNPIVSGCPTMLDGGSAQYRCGQTFESPSLGMRTLEQPDVDVANYLWNVTQHALQHYGGTLGHTLTIPAGETWTFAPGVTIRFAPGKSLIVNGILTAIGTPSQPIIFTSTSPSSTWSGIYFASGSAGTISGCTITRVHSSDGAIASITINNASPTIENCTIENNTGMAPGIRVLENATPLIKWNVVRNLPWHGVEVYNANPRLQYNNITNSTAYTGAAALRCNTYASPLLGNTSSPTEGRNTLSGYYYGIYASNHSTPTVGVPTLPTCKNRLLANSNANAKADGNITTYAYKAWWGQSPPDVSKIQVEQGSFIGYNPWLTSDPGIAFRVDEPPSPVLSVMPARSVDLQAMLLQAREERLQDDHADAVAIYKDIIGRAPESEEALTAVVELGNVFRDIQDPEVLVFLESYATTQGYLRATSLEVLANCYKIRGNDAAASTANNTLIKEFARTEYEKRARISQFFLSLNRKEYDLARSELIQVQAKYPTDEIVAVASWLAYLEGGEIEHYARQAETQQASLHLAPPNEVRLSAYPNPFNPSTTLVFRVDAASLVTLSVYDIVGRTVATLVNERKESGTYAVTWDASRWPSGMYFCKLEAAGRVTGQKLTLLK
jgi:hypothetical protein